jgi:hypothetical protein
MEAICKRHALDTWTTTGIPVANSHTSTELQGFNVCFHNIGTLSYLHTPCSRVLLEKLTGFQLVKKFPAFYGTWRFITAFTSARHMSLSLARSIQSMPPDSNSWRSILILSSRLRLGLPSGFFPSCFFTLIHKYNKFYRTNMHNIINLTLHSF